MDEKAFKKIVLACKDQVFNYALHMVRIQEDAEDITQEAFIRLWKYRWSSHIKSPRAWLFRVTHNLCIDRVRMQSRQNRAFTSMDCAKSETVEQYQQPEQILKTERKELQQQISSALANMPERFRSVIVLREIQGFSYREISEILDMKMGNVKTNIHRAKSALKKALAPYFKNFQE
ncbi:MAG: RNA polymerase sigma factor [bacterium]